VKKSQVSRKSEVARIEVLKGSGEKENTEKTVESLHAFYTAGGSRTRVQDRTTRNLAAVCANATRLMDETCRPAIGTDSVQHSTETAPK
jgi:hypothetical protein